MRKLLLVVGLCVCAAAHGAGKPATAGKPNIIFLLADDLRWDAMSCAGHPVLKTPALDRLAAGGTRFQNAFVTTSICAVSRASILTGQYARRHGVNDFATPLRSLDVTYPMLLQRGGYYVGFIGKWGVAAQDKEYCGRCAGSFDFWAGDMVQTSYWHEQTCNYITNNGTTARTNFFCSCPPQGRKGDGCGPNGPHPALKDPVHAETEFVPAKIRSFLDQRDPAKPFCLSVSFKAPHGPWQRYAPKFAKDFEGVDIPCRGNVTLAEAERQPAFLRASLANEQGLRMLKNPEERNKLFHQYYRLIEGLDECVGKLLQELQQRGLAGNTVIVFSSDNGHFSGEHGFFGKWFMHEESLRVPLIICDPRAPATRRGQTSEALALNIDIAPTILDLAGLPAPAVMQGKSLLPVTPVREEFFYEHLYPHGPKPPKHIEPSEGVRTRDWKYILWVDQTGPDREELYNLRDDPLEMKNLATDPSHHKQLIELRKRCLAYRQELK
jgi:arylsulfatase A-like enzyme